MPFQIGGVAIHNNDQHTGSANRDTASGVAGLDASGNVLGKGYILSLPRSGGNSIIIQDRTSGEQGFAVSRSGLNDFTATVIEGGSSKRVQTESMKNVASGIAGLDASALVPDAQNPAVNTTHIAAACPHTGHISYPTAISLGGITYNTTLQNTSGKRRIYIAHVNMNPAAGDTTYTIKNDSSTPPTTVTSSIVLPGAGSAEFYTLITVVEAGHYYLLSDNQGGTRGTMRGSTILTLG